MSDELAKAFSEIHFPPEVTIEYRLYYDAKGVPLRMSSHNHPDGEYIVITKEHYDSANYNCKVVGGKLTFDIANQFHIQLKKSEVGIPVVRGYANLIVENNEYEDIEYYGRNN